MTESNPPVTIEVAVDPPYPVVVGTACSRMGELIAGSHKAAILHQPTLPRRGVIREHLPTRGLTRTASRSPMPEAGKDLPVVGYIWEVLGRIGIGRKDAVVSLGGGRCHRCRRFRGGDLAAWGVDRPCAHHPAGMVDAAVGAKRGSTPTQARTWSARFHQPRAVLVDLRDLQTLPAQRVGGRMAEIVKAGFIADPVIPRPDRSLALRLPSTRPVTCCRN